MKKQINKELIFVLVLGLIAVLTLGIGYRTIIREAAPEPPAAPPEIPSVTPPTATAEKGVKKFASEDEFKKYLQEAQAQAEYFGGFGLGIGGEVMREMMPSMEAPQIMEKAAPAAAPERVSETTVQVSGIDEPDIVKTDGQEIYFASRLTRIVEPMPLMEEAPGISLPKIMLPIREQGNVNAVKAFPPGELKKDSQIDKFGDLLLSKNTLVIFSESRFYPYFYPYKDQGRSIAGYDVSDAKSPKKKWEIKLDKNTQIAGSRLYKNKIYLVTKNPIAESRPCPIQPLIMEDTPTIIDCKEIYHPTIPIPSDTTFTASIIDPASGKIEKNVSFVGSSASSVLYVSENALYLTYSYNESALKFIADFFKTKTQDIVPASFIQKLEKLSGYDIGENAKMLEFQTSWQKHLNSLSEDERLKIENELSNRMSQYHKERKREFEKTGIVKISLDDFNAIATGNAPGRPLNQFALDEYNNHLRIATTIGQSGFGFFADRGGSAFGGESENDVYVLDEKLNIRGSVQGLGLTERIYSVRFIEDKGYVVTFRQTDPLYVLDLSDPARPELKGELKIPGYSAYLNPITKDKILGFGKEGSQVKISLFDVSQPTQPAEKDKYILDEYWSEVLSTHHAFLLDKKHEIFFLPGGKGGYVFSYKNDKLELRKAISGVSAKRAVYINDYLYIIAEDKITVLNEIDWEKINELEL